MGVKYKGCHCANRSLPRYWPVAEKDVRAIVSWADPEGAELLLTTPVEYFPEGNVLLGGVSNRQPQPWI